MKHENCQMQFSNLSFKNKTGTLLNLIFSQSLQMFLLQCVMQLVINETASVNILKHSYLCTLNTNSSVV